ncbi:MAG: glycoside hydrolase family 99-like domain-containing protein [Clostridia bacterium]|nr:glycoside hydrolase family 99-like domain-containing protein [Clostridia bacterium]
MKTYDVAAYVWPAYTGDEPRTRLFWEEGMGEWQTVKNAAVKDCGYLWNRKPLWGYVNEADPQVMSKQIDAATEHGVNVFIYDWYWYDNRPFLENCLNDGFLKADNCNKMKFYIMWANHDANYTWDIRNAGEFDTTIWQGAVDRKQFEIIGNRWINQYFSKENYYKIDGKPVVSIYDLNNLISGLGGIKNTADALKWLDNQAKNNGLAGVHFQFVRWSGRVTNMSGVDADVKEFDPKLIEELGFNSLTHYQFVHFTDIDRDYTEIMSDVTKEWDKIKSEHTIPYFPHISVGWDNNPRFKEFRPGIVKNNTPENVEKALMLAKRFADESNVSLITVNSWNEWTETSYLEPDDLYGYGYLEAVKKAFSK